MTLSPRQRRLLEIETAKARRTWAKAEIKSGGPTPALTKYLRESREELIQAAKPKSNLLSAPLKPKCTEDSK
jgi:hypothetical protein